MNRDNLRILAQLLRTHVKPDHFDMTTYNNVNKNDFYADAMEVREFNECGTTACALGHGPLVFQALPGETWSAYSQRVFGIDPEGDEWNFLFDGEWADADNTPGGAAKRIDYLLDHGCPDNETIRDMQRGTEELCYE